jgi:glycosyltransferase involved in cell wall biosynthesis
MTGETFSGRVGLQQRVIPAYRAIFFESLAQKIEGGLSVFAGKPVRKEGIESVKQLKGVDLIWGHNRNLFDPSSPWYMCWQDGFIEWLEAWQPEVLIVEANPRYPVTRKAITWMHRKNRKVIGWGLGAPTLQGLIAGVRQKQRFSLLRTLDAVIAYSRRGAEQYHALGIPEGRLFVATNAAAPAPATRPVPRPPRSDGSATLLFVGRLQARKRVDLLLHACARLPTSMQPRLVVVGDGPAMDELRRLATFIYPRTEFVGAKHGAELEPYFNQADLFALPGTGGLAIQQAMAHGLPVIVAQGDGTQEDLVRNDNGWLVPPGDLQALVDCLGEALSEAGKLRQMGEASYHIVVEEINVERMVAVFVAALNGLKETGTTS